MFIEEIQATGVESRVLFYGDTWYHPKQSENEFEFRSINVAIM